MQISQQAVDRNPDQVLSLLGSADREETALVLRVILRKATEEDLFNRKIRQFLGPFLHYLGGKLIGERNSPFGTVVVENVKGEQQTAIGAQLDSRGVTDTVMP